MMTQWANFLFVCLFVLFAVVVCLLFVISSIPKYYYGDITLLVVNIHHSPVELILINELDLKSKDVYFFTPLDYNMKSK